MRAWRPAVAATAMAVLTGGAAWGSGPVSLLSVSSRVEERTAIVLIEAAEPVAYMASRPDPLTVLIDLRNVDTSEVRNRVAPSAGGPIAGVDIEQATGPDGQTVARVRVALVNPLPHSVRSHRGTIHLEFERDGAGAGGRAANHEVPLPLPGRMDGSTVERRATLLRSVRAEPRDDGFVVRLGGNGRLVPGTVGEIGNPHRVFFDFPGVAASVPRSTDIQLGPIERVRVAPHSRSPLVTRVVLDLTDAVGYTVLPEEDEGLTMAVFVRPASGARTPAPAPLPVHPVEAPGVRREGEAAPIVRNPEPGTTRRTPDGGLIVDASGTTMTTTRFIVPAERVPDGEPPLAPAVPVARPVAQAGSTSQPLSGQFSGHPVTLDFQNADLRAVLRTFAEISGLNLVIDPTVAGSVDVALREVPWDQALDIILRSNTLGYTVDGTVVRIAPLSVLAAEEDDRRKLVEAQRLSGDLHVLTRTLSYARASALADLITRATLSQRGSVQVDERTNTLIITDLRSNLDTATDLIATLDGPEPQVEIEARIVQSTSEFARAIGVQWGLTGRSDPSLGNTTPLAFPNSGSLESVVDLPVLGATSAVGLALGAVNGSLNLDLALSAAERSGLLRILSTPKVATQNNTEAEITQGVQIPIQTVANNTVTVTFKDAALTLKVTPQITAADTVIMRVELENATPDFSREVGGIPPIDTQRAITNLQVDDGQTTVIGGIYVATEATLRDRTPGMSRIPLLGWMFRRDSVRDESRELLIFITPRIIR